MTTRLDKLINDKKNQPVTTQQWVTELLREGILNGYIKDEELDTTTLAKRLGVSRMPVRTALHQLEFEGLVNMEPHKKAMATKLSPDEVRNIYEVRYELESLAIRLAIDHMTASDLVYLYDLVIQMDFCDEIDFVGLNKQFHNKLNELSQNSMLYDLNNRYRNNVERYLKLYLANQTNLKLANKEHKEIMITLKNKDKDQASELIKVHLKHTCERVVQQLYYFGYKS